MGNLVIHEILLSQSPDGGRQQTHLASTGSLNLGHTTTSHNTLNVFDEVINLLLGEVPGDTFNLPQVKLRLVDPVMFTFLGNVPGGKVQLPPNLILALSTERSNLVQSRKHSILLLHFGSTAGAPTSVLSLRS